MRPRPPVADLGMPRPGVRATSYAERMFFEFDAEVFRWTARTQDWYFAAVPDEISADIREVPRMPRGFGAVRVRARIGDSRWETSIFPDSDRGTYILPLKRSVRDAEGIGSDGIVRVGLETLDA